MALSPFIGVLFQMKRNLLLLTVITFCLALVCSVFAVSPISANATVTLKKVSGFEYELSYLVEDAGTTYQSAMTATINGVNVVKPSTEEGGTTEQAQTDAGFRTDGNKVEFLDKKSYEVVVNNEDGTQATTFTVDTTTLPTKETLKYDYTVEALTQYQEQVLTNTEVSEDGTDQMRPISVDDDYIVPSVASLVKDEYFDVENLTGTLYYAAPDQTTFSSKSINDIDSVRFEVTKVGTYSFYVVLRNNFVAMSTVDLVLGNGGWYEKDADGNPTGDVVIPVFSFSVEASSSPRVTVGASEKAYQGLQYTVNCFNIVASDYNTEYTLYFSDKKIDQEDITAYDKTTLEGLGMVEVTEDNGFEKDNLFNSSTKSFTPLKKGYYYVVLHVVDFANEHTTVISRVIDAQSELKEVEYESQFFKNNWVSVVLLTVAIVCFIAIIILLCVKPKEGSNLSTKE